MRELQRDERFTDADGMDPVAAPFATTCAHFAAVPAEALAKTSASIIEIALNHGFCDQSAFTQQFRKRTGMTPKQFRVRNRG